MQPSNMKGKAALVTGAAAFLGKATALRLALAGADICLVDCAGEELDTAAKEVRALGVDARVCAVDITQRESCMAAVAQAVTAFGRLDALCNVATVFRPSRTTNATQEDWELSLAVNLSAPFYLTQAALPHLLKTHGAVVSVLSPVAVLSHPYTAAYTASKAGLAQMTRALAAEFLEETVRINAVSFAGVAMKPGSASNVPSDLDPKLFQKFSSVRARIEIEQVADIIAFLVSDAAIGFHGSCVSLDNGISLG